MKKLIFFALLMVFVALPFASASFLPSETKDYSNLSYGYPQVEVKNLYGFGSTVAQLNLIHHTPNCFVDCESTDHIKLNEAGQLAEDVRFFDERHNSVDVPFILEYSVNESYNITSPTYETQCSNVTVYNNETNTDEIKSQCGDVQVGVNITGVGSRIVFEEYVGQVLPVGEYDLKIKAHKSPLQTIDWQIKTAGTWITSQAWFNAALPFCFPYTLNNSVNFLRQNSISDNWINVSSLPDKPYNDTIHVVDQPCGTSGNELGADAYNITQSSGLMSAFNLVIVNVSMSQLTNKTFGVYYNTASTPLNRPINITSNNANGRFQINGTGAFGFNMQYNSTAGSAYDDWQNVTVWSGSVWLDYHSDTGGNTNLQFEQYEAATLQAETITIMDGSSQNIMINRSSAGRYEVIYNIYSNGFIKAQAKNFTTNVQRSFGRAGTGSNKARLGTNNAITIDDTTNNYQGQAFGISDMSNSTQNVVIFNQSAWSSGTNPGTLRTATGSVYWQIDNANQKVIPLNYSIVLQPIKNDNVSRWINLTGDLLNPMTSFTIGAESVNGSAVTLNSPASGSSFTNLTQQFNITSTVNPVANLTNITLYVWFSNGTLFLTDFKNISGTSNNTIFQENLIDGSYIWNAQVFNNGGVPSGGMWGTNTTFTNGNVWTLCNATFPTPYLNFTFADESTGLPLNASIGSSTFNFYSSDRNASNTKTYTFSNTTVNPSYAFCAAYNNISMIVNTSITYSSTQGGTYPARTYIPIAGSQTFTNVVTNLTLYLLSSTSGQYVTFQILNVANQPLQGVSVNAQETLGGSPTTICAGTTDAAGSITCWMNPIASTTMQFSKTGYASLTNTITPSQTSYTVIMNSLSSSNVTDYSNGVSYTVLPSSPYLANQTNYNFNVSLTSTTYTITAWGYNITNSSGFVFASNSSMANGGFLSSTLNTGLNKTFQINVYYNVSNNTVYFNKIWVITNVAPGGYSISNLLTDFNLYLTNGGFFGIDSFGINLIVFLIIFSTVGIMSFKFGIYSPAAIAGLAFAETAFFDVGLGIITPPSFLQAVPNVATVFMGIAFLALAIKEATGY